MFASVFEQPAVIGALISAPVLYFGGLALGRWLKNRHQVRIGAFYHLLCLALAVYIPLRVLSQASGGLAADSWQERGLRYFGSALILLAMLFALALLRRFFWQRWFKQAHEVEAPKLLQQVFGFVAFSVVLMLVLSIRHDQRVDAFLAGSGIVAVVLGFAMQETLANIISGIALQASKPFKVGDWIVVDKLRAEVVEMNWRSTRLRTNDDVCLDIPNKTVTTTTITNLSYPTRTHAHRIRVRFQHTAPPNMVREILRRAAQNASGVLAHPPVKVFLVEFIDYAAVYEIKYSLEEEGRFNDIEDAIRTNIWYEAHRAKLEIPAPGQNVFLRRGTPDGIASRTTEATRFKKEDLFGALTEDQQKQLMIGAKVLRFGRGESIIRQGDDGSAMFFLVDGAAEVLVSSQGKELHVADLQNGTAFGEMSMLTGDKRTATVTARTDCEVWEIDRAVMTPILQENPDLAHKLSDLLAHRKIETEGLIAAQSPPHVVEKARKEYANGFFRRISALFEI